MAIRIQRTLSRHTGGHSGRSRRRYPSRHRAAQPSSAQLVSPKKMKKWNRNVVYALPRREAKNDPGIFLARFLFVVSDYY